MRAVFLASDLLADDELRAADAIQQLTGSGLRLVLIGPAEGEMPEGLAPGLAMVRLGESDSGRNGYAEALVRCASAAEVPLREACLVTRHSGAVQTAMELGLRAILVLDERSLDQLLGPSEPARKSFPAASDLAAAVSYILAEASNDRQLGAFPFAGQRSVGDRSGALVPTATDLARVMLIIVVAGVAIALGIAYILQEAYQRFTFPPIAYWLTLQFIPQTYRGLLFLAIGAVAGLFAGRIWRSVTDLRSPGSR